jgi:Spy/CpxP family protein refolding chaperone
VEKSGINYALLGVSLLAGVLIGFAGSSLAYRYHWLHTPGEEVVRRMDRMLKLTPAQREQIEETMQQTRDKTEQLRRDFQRQRRELLKQARDQIRGLLTAEQQADFDRHFARHERREAENGNP